VSAESVQAGIPLEKGSPLEHVVGDNLAHSRVTLFVTLPASEIPTERSENRKNSEMPKTPRKFEDRD